MHAHSSMERRYVCGGWGSVECTFVYVSICDLCTNNCNFLAWPQMSSSAWGRELNCVHFGAVHTSCMYAHAYVLYVRTYLHTVPSSSDPSGGWFWCVCHYYNPWEPHYPAQLLAGALPLFCSYTTTTWADLQSAGGHFGIPPAPPSCRQANGVVQPLKRATVSLYVVCLHRSS